MASEHGKDQFVQEFTQDKIVFADRVPRSSDKGQLWVYYTASSAVLYVRNPRTGTWYAQA